MQRGKQLEGVKQFHGVGIQGQDEGKLWEAENMVEESLTEVVMRRV